MTVKVFMKIFTYFIENVTIYVILIECLGLPFDSTSVRVLREIFGAF